MIVNFIEKYFDASRAVLIFQSLCRLPTNLITFSKATIFYFIF